MSSSFTIVTSACDTPGAPPLHKSGPAVIPFLPREVEKDKNSGSSRPLVSIITVCRNAESTIGRTLRSIELQTYPNLEYIVVDGGSTDGTLELIKGCPVVDRWLSEPDNGIADAFNKGIALARGEWIGILNADDWYEEDTVAAILAASDGADVVHGAVRYWDGHASREVYHPRQDRLHLEMTVNHPSVFVRRSLYERLGGFDTDYQYAMDYELLLRFMAAGARFRQLEKVLANMGYGGASDAHWRAALAECALAKSVRLGRPVLAVAYCCGQIVRGIVRRGLEKLGLYGLVQAFRKRFSIVPKT